MTVAVGGLRRPARGVEGGPCRDVAVAERHDDVWPEVGPLDGRAARQRRGDGLRQSQTVAVGRRDQMAVVADLVQPLDTARRH